MGVWIEIEVTRWNYKKRQGVAPFVGVWIEIPLRGQCVAPLRVAPFVGVWIEIPRQSENAV